jgi:hypothetical protein
MPLTDDDAVRLVNRIASRFKSVINRISETEIAFIDEGLVEEEFVR